MKTKFTISFELIILILLTSCSDSRLARDAVGSWRGHYNISYDDGSKEKVEQELQFQKDENKDGGVYTEILYGTQQDREDEMNMVGHYTSTIKGTWEVTAGDLNITYDISSLNVNVDENDIKLNYDNPLQGFSDELSSIYDTFSSIESSVATEMQKAAYQSLFHQYKESNNENAPYADLEIEKNTLSFETSDMGRMTYTKIEEAMPDSTATQQSSTENVNDSISQTDTTTTEEVAPTESPNEQINEDSRSSDQGQEISLKEKDNQDSPEAVQTKKSRQGRAENNKSKNINALQDKEQPEESSKSDEGFHLEKANPEMQKRMEEMHINKHK